MAMLQLDDTRGLADTMVFPKVYAKCAEAIREDAIVKVRGRVERKEGLPRIVALDVEELRLEPGPDPVYLDAGSITGKPRATVDEVFGILERHPGDNPLFLISSDGAFEEGICTVEDSNDLHAELKQLLGVGCISAVRRVAYAPQPIDEPPILEEPPVEQGFEMEQVS